MADCDSIVLTPVGLTCHDDVEAWSEELLTQLQSAFDHVINCIRDFELPQLDICVLRDDLIECPLTAREMIDFSGISWGEGGIGTLPLPPGSSGGLEFRYGSGTVAGVNDGDWASAAITFDEPFSNQCLGVLVTLKEYESGGGVFHLFKTYQPIVRDITTSGFVVWMIMAEDPGTYPGRTARFSYMAFGT